MPTNVDRIVCTLAAVRAPLRRSDGACVMAQLWRRSDGACVTAQPCTPVNTIQVRERSRTITQPAEAAPMPQTSIARWPLCTHPSRLTRLRRSDGACDTAQPCTRVNTIERKNTTKKFRSVSTSALQNLPVGTPCRSDPQSQFADAWPGCLAKFLMDGCRPWCHSELYPDPPRLCNTLLISIIEILGRNRCFS